MMTITLNGNYSKISIDLENLKEDVALLIASKIKEVLDSTEQQELTPDQYAQQLAKTSEGKLYAVKALKEKFGLDLKTAKDLMDKYM